MIGTTFLERYQIESLLGTGGMGAVYRAHDLLLDRLVALKVLSGDRLGSEGRTHLLREARAAARLNHPNIVTVYDAGENQGGAFITMELVEGKSLSSVQPAGLDEILTIAIQICDALDHAHLNGIVHRDLKPENVLVTPTGHVKLMDFGMARPAATRLSVQGAIEGTIFYMAPEQALGQEINARADLYAFGVMLYEMVVGKLPFYSEDPLSVITQHLYAPIVPPRACNPKTPPTLEALILQLLNKLPEDRPASAHVVQQTLQRITAGETGAAPVHSPTLLDRIVRGRLVGREEELALAVEAWRNAAAGQSQVLLISGDPGIGKTRLALEVTTKAQISGARILKGECYAEGGAPYAPIAQMIEKATGMDALERIASLPDLLTVAPRLKTRYPNLYAGPLLDPKAEQERLFESFVDLAAALSSQAPLLVVLEDAHWADSGSLSLLRHLARRARALELRLLILLTYREIELDEARALSQVLYDFNRERLAQRIKLTRLNRSQTNELLATILSEAPSPDLLESIYRETEGNPFFTEEVCKALIEQGQLTRSGDHWLWSPTQEIEIPQSIKTALQARMSQLSPAALDSLRIASIFGRQFSFDLLLQVSDLSEEALIEALEDAGRAQLITEQPQADRQRRLTPSFTFAHALIGSTLRESMSGLRRQRLHQRAALALERQYPDQLDELAPQLGEHFTAAGNWDKAISYLLRAGDRARQLYTYPEAIAYYQQALILLKEQADYEQAARTLMKLGLLYHAVFDFQGSRQAYQEGFALRKEAGSAALALPPAPHALRLVANSPLTLDPSLAYEMFSVSVIQQLFSGLVSLTADLELVPDQAQSWEILEDGLQYRFHLRPDCRWSDGTALTARDFEFAWKRVLDPQARSHNPLLLYDLRGAREYHEGRAPNADAVGVRALDPFTLLVELEQPVGYFLHLMACPAVFPAPEHALQVHGDNWAKPENLVSNGPFRLVEWLPGEQIVLERNPMYTGRFAGNLEKAVLSLRSDHDLLENRLAAYEAGELDAIHLGDPLSLSTRARQAHAEEYVVAPMANVSFLVFNTRRPPFDDLRVRQAFTHALDRETIVEVIMLGYVSPCTGGITPPGLPGHIPDIALKYAPDLARRLMAEAGYPDGRGFPEIEVWMPGPRTHPARTALLEYWQEHLGVKVQPEIMTEGEMYERLVYANPHIFHNGWLGDYPDPDNFLRVGITFEARWSNPQFNQLVEKARRISDQAERMQLYRQAELLLAQEAAFLPLTYGRAHMLIKPWVRRFPISSIQPLVLRDIVIEAHEPGS